MKFIKIKSKKEKTKQKRIFRKIFAVIALIISLNIVLVYMNAESLSAETEVVIPDKNIEVEIQDVAPEFTNAIDCYLYAEKLLQQTTSYATTTGEVKGVALGKTWLHQTMDNTRYTDNNGLRYSTSISLKKGSIGRNNYQNVVFDTSRKDGLVYRIVSDTSNFSNSSWDTYTQEEYKLDSGDLPGNSIYIVRESTIKKVVTFERTSDGGYHLKFELDNKKSTEGYKRLVKNSAGSFASGFPVFQSVSVEVWIDSNGRFQKYIMDDKAKIKIIGMDCIMVSHYEETFHIIGGNVEAPFDIPFTISK